jgi:hypothetical protein
MPIRLNLLAESQALEEARRKDPVKRAIWIAVILVSGMLLWSGLLQLKSMVASSDLNGVQLQMNTHSNQYKVVLAQLQETAEIQGRLNALHQLTTNRFLNGTMLNALQQATADEVQLIRLHTEQSYTLVEGTKPRTNEDMVIPGKPSTVTEKLVLALEGNDLSSSAGDQVAKFKEIVSHNPYFKEVLDKTNAVSLKSLSAPTVLPGGGKVCVQFALECRYPEKTRQ